MDSMISTDQLHLFMRLMVDVAALKIEPVVQRQRLIDGLQQLFRCKIGWLGVADNWRPDLRVILRHQVLTSNAMPDWLQYMSDFSVNYPLSADVYADYSLRSNDPVQVWQRYVLLPDAAAAQKYPACKAVLDGMKLGDGVVAGYRTEADGNRLVAFSLHRDENDPRFTTSDAALFRFAVEEIREMERRDFIEFREVTDNDLAPRLAQILDRILAGKSPKQMAAELRLSMHTVREHIQRLYKRYGVNSREDLTAKFLQ